MGWGRSRSQLIERKIYFNYKRSHEMIGTFGRRLAASTAVLALSFSSAQASTIRDLTTSGTVFTTGATAVNAAGAAFLKAEDLQPTGSGVFNSFVRLQMSGAEQGVNTDA